MKKFACVVFFAYLAFWISGAAGVEQVRVRVLSYNIHLGVGMDKKLDLARIAKVIERTRADLAALQEVDRLSHRVKGIDEPAELARLTGMNQAFGKALDVPGGEYGELILSRWPLKDVKRHEFSSEEGCEPRAAITAKVQLGEGGPEILFVGTHLEHANARVRLRQVESLVQILNDAKPHPAILAGDFNDTPDSPVLKTILEDNPDVRGRRAVGAGENGPVSFVPWHEASPSLPGGTWPADKPTMKIDYVFYRPAGSWRVVSAEVVAEPAASDHRPVLAVLEWQGEGANRP